MSSKNLVINKTVDFVDLLSTVHVRPHEESLIPSYQVTKPKFTRISYLL